MHIDNSQGMSPEQVKQTLTNLINKSAEKVASEGKYDRTILAKIQYCSDAVLGQYKIQYQNGYYTAYAINKTAQYNDGSLVYVTVPGNDLNNRLFIQDLATNDSSQKTYLTNLEGDQQYAVTGPNFINNTIDEDGLNMSSHWDMTRGREVTYYEYSDVGYNPNNKISLISIAEITHAIRNGDGFIRFGAEFKTDLADDRKLQGNYGIRLVLVFDNVNPVTQERTEYTQTYQLDTFKMDGAPFEFTDYAPRYQYWEIDKDNFKRVQSISGFVTGFPQSEIEPIDIFVKNISIYSAQKLYDSVANDDYVVKVLDPNGSLFGLDDSVTSLPFEAKFTVRGNEVSDEQKNVEYYWAKKNIAVDSVGHPKYLKYFGPGWQCLNQNEISRVSADDPSVEELKDFIVDSDEFPIGYKGIVKWISSKNISLPRTLCKGRQTIIKCCVVYENNQYYSREYIVTNINGYYILLNSSNGTEFYNCNGYTTLTAGVFKTEVVGAGDAATYKPTPSPYSINSKISYKWEVVNNGVSTLLPATASSDLYESQPDWSTTKQGEIYRNLEDTVEVDESTVNSYLQQLSVDTGIEKILLSCCLERYNYYNDKANDPELTDVTKKNRAINRRNAIISNWQNYLDSRYNEDFSNDMGLYILGPSNVTAEYTTLTEEDLKKLYDSGIDPLDTIVDAVEINSIEHLFNESTPYQPYQQNTLYNFQISKIAQQAVFKITALLTEDGFTEALETKEIAINNTEGSGLKYNLEIVNGDQTYMYDAGGKAPKITIRPLSYRLYDKGGALVFDSAGEDSELVVTKTKPQWNFYRTSTLLTTKYSTDLSMQYRIDTDFSDKAILSNAAIFYYDIASDFNVDYKERSNIELSITYLDETYTASTHFTFAKQGDLGTNGTNMALEIEDPIYEQYRSDILTNYMYSRFKQMSGAEITSQPDERHLKNTYMYATKVFTNMDGLVTEVTNFDEGDFCNLRFAHGVEEDPDLPPTNPMHFKVHGTTATTIYGYWYENGTHTLVDASSKWYASGGEHKDVQDQTKYGRSRIYDRASFQLSSSAGSSVNLTLIPPTGVSESEYVYYKPFDIIYRENQKDYEWTANNVVQCTAKRVLNGQIDPDTQTPIKRTNYGYYQIPFFYYAYYKNRNGRFVNETPENLDPARHFVITGGYDEVVYGADGFNPQYNGLQPFTLHLFDAEGNDISDTVFSNNRATVTWNTSYGFREEPVVTAAPAYNTYGRDVNLYNKYCTYNNKTYKCIKDHTPNEYVAIRDPKYNTIIKEYNKNTTPGNYDFITPYWEEVATGDLNGQTRKLTPPPSYEACAVDSLFNSWISVKVVYNTGSEKIEAAALIPINVLCNVYGSDEINAWDGKKTLVDDGYIISSKASAGIKNDDNTFTGITLGRKMITNGTTDDDEVGLFGYGKYYDGASGRSGYGQTLFLDAKTGLAAFGPRGSTQIILNPKVPAPNSRDETWSRLAGWYFSPNYLYKPLWADDNYISSSGDDFMDRNNSSYFNTNPPDADGVKIPGSVGLYVPGSERSGGLTADTVFMWASAANISSTSFDDHGGLTALKKLISSIKSLMIREDFPLAYPLTAVSKQIKPSILTYSTLRNYTQLRQVYSNDNDIITLLNSYFATWSNMITAIQQDGRDEGLYDDVRTAAYNISVDFANESFPTVVRDGVSVTPVNVDGITIENIVDILMWYVNSPEPSVTEQSEIISTLAGHIDIYLDAYAAFARKVYTVLTTEANTLETIVQQLVTMINTKGVRVKLLQTWNTSHPYVGDYDEDGVTINNVAQLQDYYIRPAVGATEDQQGYITSLNEKLVNYINLHTEYEQWRAQYLNDGQAISYLDDNSKKRKANFYLTYGGELHCNKVDVSGKIAAKTGYIGPDNAHSLQISTYHYDKQTGKTQFYLLYNDKFRVKGSDADTVPSVYIDGTIMARSGQIGNAAETADGSDRHTVFMEYNWYPRKLPDNDSKWSDETQSGSSYRSPEWDTTQGKIVKYALWHPYFSIIDSPGGAKNYKADGTTVDFTYSAGDTAFIGRVYAQGGRIGDWIADQTHNMLRDPYATIKFHPVTSSVLRSGYLNCGKTIIYGDGSINGACTTPASSVGTLPSNPVWWITADGEAHFTNPNSDIRGKTIRVGGATITEQVWDLPVGAKVKWGNAELGIGESGFSFNEGASFAKDVHFTKGATFGEEISINGGDTFLGSRLHFAMSDIQVGPGSAVLPATEMRGNFNCNSYNITNASSIYCNNIYVGNKDIYSYIREVVSGYLGGGNVVTDVTYSTRQISGETVVTGISVTKTQL